MLWKVLIWMNEWILMKNHLGWYYLYVYLIHCVQMFRISVNSYSGGISIYTNYAQPQQYQSFQCSVGIKMNTNLWRFFRLPMHFESPCLKIWSIIWCFRKNILKGSSVKILHCIMSPNTHFVFFKHPYSNFNKGIFKHPRNKKYKVDVVQPLEFMLIMNISGTALWPVSGCSPLIRYKWF